MKQIYSSWIKTCVALPCFMLSLIICFSQTISGQDSIAVISGALLEDLLENNDEQAYDFFSLYDELQVYLKNPININTATADDFRNMGMLSDIQILQILNHREDYGDFISTYELQSVPSLDIGTLNAFIPLVSVGDEGSRKNIGELFSEADHTIVGKYKRTLQTKKGFRDDASSPFLGDQNHYYMRYNMTSGRNLRMGLTLEKDAGEEFFTGSNKKGFDYYSGFMYLKDISKLVEDFNLGDYSISMGQGLILHNSFGSGKSSYVMNVKRGGRVIRPYSSVNEFNLLRGVATTLQVTKKVELTAFASTKKIDGNAIINDTLIEGGFQTFSSFVINGLHRTEAEIAKRGTVTQNSFGGVVKWQPNRNLKLGMNILHNNFSSDLTPRDVPYRKFLFSGDQLTNISIDYSYRYENFNLFGEVARSDNGGLANLHGVLISMGRFVDASVVYRNYDKDYHVLNANAFGETSQPFNEQGVYLAMQFYPWRSIKFSTYFDLWKHPWLRSRSAGPTDGREFLAKIEYNKKRKFNVYLQYRFEEKGENSRFSEQGLRSLVDRVQHRARLNFTYTYSRELSLISRVEYNHFEKEGETSQGVMVFQDVKYKPIGKPYSLALRYSIFDTDDFNSRIYTYENDVLYEFSIPFYSGSGTRFYIKSQYRLSRKVYVQLRYSRTYLHNVSDILLPDGSYLPLTIGSGNDSTEGNVRSEVKFVVRYKI